jgi:hypothetical protein
MHAMGRGARHVCDFLKMFNRLDITTIMPTKVLVGTNANYHGINPQFGSSIDTRRACCAGSILLLYLR